MERRKCCVLGMVLNGRVKWPKNGVFSSLFCLYHPYNSNIVTIILHSTYLSWISSRKLNWMECDHSVYDHLMAWYCVHSRTWKLGMIYIGNATALREKLSSIEYCRKVLPSPIVPVNRESIQVRNKKNQIKSLHHSTPFSYSKCIEMVLLLLLSSCVST